MVRSHRNSKTRIAFTAVLFAAAVLAASAQVTVSVSSDPPASREDILKLFDVMQVRSQMNAIMTQVMGQMRTMSHEQMKKQNPNITEAELAKVDASSQQLIQEMPIDGMLDDMIPVYQKHLTKADVDSMVGFYSTPTGQKLLREMPAIVAEGMQAVQPRLLRQMTDTMQKAQQLAKPGTAKPVPAPPKN